MEYENVRSLVTQGGIFHRHYVYTHGTHFFKFLFVFGDTNTSVTIDSDSAVKMVWDDTEMQLKVRHYLYRLVREMTTYDR